MYKLCFVFFNSTSACWSNSHALSISFFHTESKLATSKKLGDRRENELESTLRISTNTQFTALDISLKFKLKLIITSNYWNKIRQHNSARVKNPRATDPNEKYNSFPAKRCNRCCRHKTTKFKI